LPKRHDPPNVCSVPQLIVFDYVQRQIDGELLNFCITEERATLRILGTNNAPVVDCKAMMMMNGNQLAFSGDITRRVVLAHLDTRMERPETKKYASDPLEMVRKNRAAYVADCLTIIRAHHVAGHPGTKGLAVFNSFADWSKWVRGALVWLDEADPVTSVDGIRKDDPNRQKIVDVMLAWGAAFGDKEITAAEVVRHAMATAYPDDGRDGQDALLDALKAAAANRTTGDLAVESLGYWLRGKRGRPFAGMKFIKNDDTEKTKNGNIWKLVGY
jgi:putative DNA primase/helicase